MRLVSTILVLCVGGLIALGLVMLYSLGMNGRTEFLWRQMIWIALGLVVCLSMSAVDYAHLKKISLILLLFSMALLLLVLVSPYGVETKGARRWFVFNKVRIGQPSELAKIALIIVLAHFGEHYQRQMGSFRRGLMPAFAIIASVLALILPEPDRGTTLFLGGISVIILLLAGARWLVVVLPVSVGALGLVFLLWHDPLVINRVINGWLHMEQYKLDVGRQGWLSQVAIGSGGLTGVGLGNGRFKLGFLSENRTDFIFANVGEELGLVATVSVVAAFLALVICGFLIARRARDLFGFLLASGLTCLIGLQAWLNIAVVTSVLPNKGLSLPFVSYGGSNLVMMLFAVGILLSVARHSHQQQHLVSGMADQPSEVPE